MKLTPSQLNSAVKRYVDNLRIMRHEQLNRMTTLSGLLHMGHYDEAIRYIQAQSEHAGATGLHLLAFPIADAMRPAAG